MAEIEAVLRKEITAGRTPSVQYLLFDKTHIIQTYRLGLSDIAENKNVTAQTTYNAFSVTKTITALAVLQLAETKLIDLEQPVKNYLPDFPYASNSTIQQLLSHTAGIPNPVPLNWIHLATEHASFDRNGFFKSIFLKHHKTKSSPGQKFAYSNLGYVLLGQLIEQVTGTSYEQYVTAAVIDRMGLNTGELGFEIPDIGRHAKGYHKKRSFTNLLLGFFINKPKYMSVSEKGWKPFLPFYVNGASYGGLIGTPHAFAKYIQHMLQPNDVLLSDSFKKRLFTENHTTNGKPTGMCLSWFSGQLNGNRYYAHAGGGGGFYCEIRIYPDNGIGSVIFFNRTGMSDERFLDKVDRFYL